MSSLEFQLSSLVDERELAKIGHEKTVRGLELRVRDEGKRADKLESDNLFLFGRQETLAAELEAAHTDAAQTQAADAQTIRALEQQVAELRLVHTGLEADNRQLQAASQRSATELTARVQALERTNAELDAQLQESIESLNGVRLSNLELEEALAELSEDNKRLQGAAAEADSVAAVQRQLAEQLDVIGGLERELAAQTVKLRRLEDDRRLVAVVEEEKAALETRLEAAEQLRGRLVDAELQLAEAQAQQDKWAAFLARDETFGSPEDVVRKLVAAQAQNAGLLQRVARVEAELAASGPTVEQMRGEIDRLDGEMQAAKQQLVAASEARMRAERQRELAATEVSFLRGQIASYDSEEAMLLEKLTGSGSSITSEALAPLENLKATRIRELEQLLDKSREEVGRVSKELEKRDGAAPNVGALSPLKRRLTPFSSGERVAELTRKLRVLQVELDGATLGLDTRTRELEAAQRRLTRLESAQKSSSNSSSKVRVLELKDNPAARHDAIKMSTLAALRKENEALLEQLAQTQATTPGSERRLVPYASLEAVRNEKRVLSNTVADLHRRVDRLKQVYARQSLDFREAVYALVGYKVDLLPNRKIRATSKFAASDDDAFVFVPEGTSKNSGKLKFSGIEDGPLASEYENLVTFWIKERRDIACFLAALNLEMYDKTTKAASF